MSRGRKFFHAIWSGYVLTIVVAAVNFLTIPLALSILGKPAFGLWSAVMQVTNLTNILDLGLGPSMARFLTDYKDHHDVKDYAGFVKSIFVVAIFQGLVFVVAMACLIPYLPGLMRIPAEQSSVFKWLLALQLASTALGFPLRPLTQLLYANQRLAWFNGCSVLANLVNAGVLCFGLKAGWGVYVYPVAAWAAFLVLQTGIIAGIKREGLLPPLSSATVCLRRLKPLAAFSMNVSLIVVGLQLINFAPTLLITRKLGIQALADWTVGTRLMLFAWQLISKVSSSSEPFFWEMFVRNEMTRLRDRLLGLLPLVCSAAALLGGGIAAINPPFIRLWTGGRVAWMTAADVCLVVWLVVLAAATVLNMAPGITKKLGATNLVYFFEGLVPVSLAYLPIYRWGSPVQVALLLGLCLALFRLPYGFWRTQRDFQIPVGLLLKTLLRCGAVMLLLVSAALALRAATGGLPSFLQVLINGPTYLCFALPVIYWKGLSLEQKHRVNQALGRFFPQMRVPAIPPTESQRTIQHTEPRSPSS